MGMLISDYYFIMPLALLNWVIEFTTTRLQYYYKNNTRISHTYVQIHEERYKLLQRTQFLILLQEREVLHLCPFIYLTNKCRRLCS